MNNLIVSIIYLLLFVVNSLGFPVTAGVIPQLFYCNFTGCAANVTRVFCNDKLLLDNQPIMNCSGYPPPPNTVCQRDGYAFASSRTGVCEFEGKLFIKTAKCEGLGEKGLNPICVFPPATTLSPGTTQVDVRLGPGHITLIEIAALMLVCLAILAILAILAKCCYKKKNKDQNKPGEDIPLQPLHTNGVTGGDPHTGNGNGLENGRWTKGDTNSEHAQDEG